MQETSDRIMIGINYAKEEIEIRIESLKNELETLKIKLYDQLDEYIVKLNEYIIIKMNLFYQFYKNLSLFQFCLFYLIEKLNL